MKVALAGLLAFLTMAAMAACGEETAPTPTVPPAPTATPTPAPASTATPAPTPAPESPEDFLDAALERMADAGSVAFDLRMEMSIETDDGSRSVSATYSGDMSRFVYTTGTLAVDGLSGATESRIVTFNYGLRQARYVLDDGDRGWRPREPLPEVMDIAHFLNPGSLVDEGFLPPQTLNGVAMRGAAGRYRSGSPGIEGDFDVTYWVGAEDGLLHRLSATAPNMSVSGWAKLGGLSGRSGAVKLTLDLSDYGKPVALALPGFALPIFSHAATPLMDGRVLVTGGFTGVANNNFIAPFPVGITQIYDAETETWTLLDPLDGHSMLNSAARLQDGRVLIVGLGLDDEGAASIFDPSDDSWKLLPNRPAARGFPNIVLLDDGRALAVGGADLTGSGYAPDPAAAVEVFDPETGEWSEAARMTRAAIDQALVALPGGLALAMQPGSDERRSPFAEVYDSTADVWRPTTPRQALNFYSERPPEAIALRDGRALVTGWSNIAGAFGDDEQCDPASASALGIPTPEPCDWTGYELYDPVTDEWTLAAPMTQPRTGHTLTLLPDGRVLAAGGELIQADYLAQYETVVLATTELFDPSSNSWAPGPDLAKARTHHTATLLPDGRVLFVGGISQEVEPNPPDSQVEIYPTNSVETLDFSG